MYVRAILAPSAWLIVHWLLHRQCTNHISYGPSISQSVNQSVNQSVRQSGSTAVPRMRCQGPRSTCTAADWYTRAGNLHSVVHTMLYISCHHHHSTPFCCSVLCCRCCYTCAAAQQPAQSLFASRAQQLHHHWCQHPTTNPCGSNTAACSLQSHMTRS